MGQPEEVVSLYRGRFLELVRRGKWEFVQRVGNGGKVPMPVGVVAMTAEGRVLFITQYRVPMGRVCVEMPAGLIGDKAGEESEGWELAARRELLEETGYEAETMEFLVQGATSAGLTTECMTFARARGLRKVGPAMGDGEEDITVHEVPLGEVEKFLAERVAAGELVDPKVYLGLYFLGGG